MFLLKRRLSDDQLVDAARQTALEVGDSTLYWFNTHYEFSRQSGMSVKDSVSSTVRKLGLTSQLLIRLNLDALP